MLTIVVPMDEFYDDETSSFVVKEEVQLDLEHSLVSLSKWESIYKKPFLADGTKTPEEILTYVKCMTLTPDFPPEVFYKLSKENVDKINAYIESTETATWFAEDRRLARGREVITSELIYYWLVTFNIPFEVQHWHINRLFTLVKVINTKNSKPKKMSRAEMAQRNRELNARRKQELGTAG